MRVMIEEIYDLETVASILSDIASLADWGYSNLKLRSRSWFRISWGYQKDFQKKSGELEFFNLNEDLIGKILKAAKKANVQPENILVRRKGKFVACTVEYIAPEEPKD